MSEPVKIDSIPVELNKTQQKKWDTGDETLREQIRETIRGYRAEDGPQFDPPTEGYVENVGQRHFEDDE